MRKLKYILRKIVATIFILSYASYLVSILGMTAFGWQYWKPVAKISLASMLFSFFLFALIDIIRVRDIHYKGKNENNG